MVFHKSRTGRCREYGLVPTIRTSKLDADVYDAGPQSNQTISTKWVRSRNVLQIRHLEGEAAKHFKQCKQGESCIWNKYRKFDNGVAECAFRKEVT